MPIRAPTKLLKKIGLGAVTCILLLVGFVWFLAMPRGELRLVLDPAIQSDETKARLAFSVFQRAETDVGEAEKHHGTLSFRRAARVQVAVPPTASPGGNRLADFITDFVVKTSVDSESGQIALSLNGIAVLEALYGTFGIHDYFLVVTDMGEIECLEGKDPPCLRIIAKFSPSSLRPEEFKGTLEELGQDLAVMIVRGAVSRAGNEWRQINREKDVSPPFLLAASTPENMSSLEATAVGMAILKMGESHPKCTAVAKREECRKRAEEAFLDAIASRLNDNVSNSPAALGLALIELDKSFSGSQSHQHAEKIETSLKKAHRWLKAARQSWYLRESIQDTSALNQFGLLKIEGVALDESLYDLVERYICALHSYRRADWQGCIDKIGDPKTYPLPIRPYIEAANLEARLHLATDPRLRVEILKGVESIIFAKPSRFSAEKNLRQLLYQRVAARYMCMNPDDFDARQFEEISRAIIVNPLVSKGLSEVILEVSDCYPNASLPFRLDLENIKSEINGTSTGVSVHRIQLELAKYFVRVNDLDNALVHAKKALPLPYAGTFIQNSPAFKPLMKSDDHGWKLIRAHLSQEDQIVFEACHQLVF